MGYYYLSIGWLLTLVTAANNNSGSFALITPANNNSGSLISSYSLIIIVVIGYFVTFANDGSGCVSC